MSLTKVYDFFGGFGEFTTVTALAAAITLAAVGRLGGAFASALIAIGGWGIIHDQLSQWNDRQDHNGLQS